MKKILLAVGFLLMMTVQAHATTRYVRPDGGTGTQCTGLADVAYPGTGTSVACAVNHPNWIFPPRSESTTRAAAAGDTVVIRSGSYRIGCQNASTCRDSNVNLTQSSFCSAAASYDCYMGTVPSGVTIVGCTVNGCTSQALRPELWGAGRVTRMFKLSGSNTILKDLDITDHAQCGWSAPTNSCGPADSSELSAQDGVDLTGTTGTILRDVNVHDLWRYGILAGSVGDLTIDGDSIGSSAVTYNSAAGINFDTCNNDGTCGVANGKYVHFYGNNPSDMMDISWNGCIRAYPAGANPVECHTSYGDGFGTTGTSGTWVINYLRMVHNTSDGLDLRYCYKTGCTVDVRNSHFGGNAGNQFKATGGLIAYNNLIEGDCDYFVGKSYTAAGFSHCRAVGDELFLGFQDGTITKKFYGNTVINAKGNVLFDGCAFSGYSCTAANTIDFQNNIFSSPGKSSVLSSGSPGYKYLGPNNNSDASCGPCESVGLTQTYSNIYGFTSNPAGTGNVFTNSNLSGVFDSSTAAAQLAVTSPAKDAGTNAPAGQPTTDFNSFSHAGTWDMGFLEYGSSYSGTPPACGDNIKNGNEICDGTDLNSQTCVTQGYTSGTLACSADCNSFNTSSCVTNLCGNGTVDSGEQCDGSNLNGQTCLSQGYLSGSLSCASNCLSFVTTSCVAAVCGDGTITAPEECDDHNTNNGDGCSSICGIEGVGLEKLLLYTETDPSSYLTVATNRVSITGIPKTVSANLKKDFGASHFGNFTHRFKVTEDSCFDNGAGQDGGVTVWAVSANSYADSDALDAASDGIRLEAVCKSSSADYHWTLYGAESPFNVDRYQDAIPVVTRYFEVSRSGSTVTAKLYSDAAYTNLLHTMTIAATATPYRYYYPVMSFSVGASGSLFSGKVDTINLDAGPPPASGCQGTTIGSCTLSTSANSATSGTCSVNGTCSYTCNNGTWVIGSDLCTGANQTISIQIKGGSLIGVTVH